MSNNSSNSKDEYGCLIVIIFIALISMCSRLDTIDRKLSDHKNQSDTTISK